MQPAARSGEARATIFVCFKNHHKYDMGKGLLTATTLRARKIKCKKNQTCLPQNSKKQHCRKVHTEDLSFA